MDESSQVSSKDKDLQRISALLASSVESRLTSIVSNFVDGVLNHLSAKVDTLEKENSDLRTKVEELQTKLEKTTADLEQTNQYTRRNSVRISGISESSDNSTDEAVLYVAKEIGSAITIADIDSSHRLGKPKTRGTTWIFQQTTRYSCEIYFIPGPF